MLNSPHAWRKTAKNGVWYSTPAPIYFHQGLDNINCKINWHLNSKLIKAFNLVWSNFTFSGDIINRYILNTTYGHKFSDRFWGTSLLLKNRDKEIFENSLMSLCLSLSVCLSLSLCQSYFQICKKLQSIVFFL